MRACAQYIEAQYPVDVQLVHIFHTSINRRLAAIGLRLRKRCTCEEHNETTLSHSLKAPIFFHTCFEIVFIYKIITVLASGMRFFSLRDVPKTYETTLGC